MRSPIVIASFFPLKKKNLPSSPKYFIRSISGTGVKVGPRDYTHIRGVDSVPENADLALRTKGRASQQRGSRGEPGFGWKKNRGLQ